MSARFVGSVSLAAALPSLSARLDLAFDLLGTLAAAFRAELVAEVRASLDAQIEVGVELGVTPPGVALDLMVQGALEAVANLQVTPPDVQLSAQAEVNAALVAELEAKLAALELVLSPIEAALSARLDLSAPGVRLYLADGPLSSALGEVDDLANSGHAGSLPPSTNVKAVVLVVDAGNAPASAALDLTFAAGT